MSTPRTLGRAVHSLRFAAVIGAALGAAGCGDDATPTAAPTSRFEAVQSATGGVDQVLGELCDLSFPAAQAPAWQPPATDAAIVTHRDAWTWVNVWATWCHPCLDELPVLERTLGPTAPIRVSFVSADATAEDLASFRTARSFTAPSPRLREPGGLAPVLAGIGYRGVSSLPVHILVDAEQKVRCVRAGLVEPRHLEQVLTALGGAQAPRIR